MFEVLAFVYENYWGGDACPELPALQRKLRAVGFDGHEVLTALLWLEHLKSAARRLTPSSGVLQAPERSGLAADSLAPLAAPAMRILLPCERDRLEPASWGLLVFLSSIGVLPQQRFELVMDQVMAAPGDPICLEDIKLIVLMMFWSLGQEPDALVLDELCDNRDFRLPN